MVKYKEKYSEFENRIYDYMPGEFLINFDAGYSSGNGSASFKPFANAFNYLNDSNYDDLEGDLDKITCTISCWLDIHKDAETGKLSFEEEVDWYAYYGDKTIDREYREFTDKSEPAVSDLIFQYIDLQCRDTLGKSLDELLDGPEISIPPKEQ